MRKRFILMLMGFGPFYLQLPAQADIDCSAHMLQGNEAITECALQAEAWCRMKLQHAQGILEGLLKKSPEEYNEEDRIAAEKLEHFWGIKPVEYGGQLPAAIENIQKVRNLAPVNFIHTWDQGSICENPSRAFARTDGGDNTNIYPCAGWEMRSMKCRRQTIMHEMFHLIGLKDWTLEAQDQNNGFVHPVGWRMTDAERFSVCVIALVYTHKTRDQLADDVCVWEVTE